MDKLDQLNSDMAAMMRLALDDAYEAGFAAGKESARAELLTKLNAVLSSDEPVSASFTPSSTDVRNAEVATDNGSVEVDRAAPGTVKPAVLKLIQDNPRGLTRRQIIEMTGFKHNSVRGTLWQLNTQEDAVVNYDGKWYPKGSPHIAEARDKSARYQMAIAGIRDEPPDAFATDGSKPGSTGGSYPPENHSNPAQHER
ncbi:hypothetical protein KEU06_07910 [Pseudaminobacter sp. 19-2017]|uniref:Uncharacterized protein n=1 Tax=Pseudaminobacter soli (ex Zhang et al. 2022) TaxID=2831468 RepID=A0A942E4X6_9HYPH|nr:hypothetical protein [Pseudaminobacter soli]MBS3648552.1 hypothetical protein [Pseudaminobacter soli]